MKNFTNIYGDYKAALMYYVLFDNYLKKPLTYVSNLIIDDIYSITLEPSDQLKLELL
jgi:hypothetical protein